MDAGYDFESIYQQLQTMNAHGNIAYNKRNERETLGLNEHFPPTCVREHSFDMKAMMISTVPLNMYGQKNVTNAH